MLWKCCLKKWRNNVNLKEKFYQTLADVASDEQMIARLEEYVSQKGIKGGTILPHGINLEKVLDALEKHKMNLFFTDFTQDLMACMAPIASDEQNYRWYLEVQEQLMSLIDYDFGDASTGAVGAAFVTVTHYLLVLNKLLLENILEEVISDVHRDNSTDNDVR